MKVVKKILKNKKLLLAGVFSAILLFLFPQLVEGWALDPAKAGLQGIAEVTSPIFAVMIFSVFLMIVGTGVLYASTALLQGVIDMSPELLTVMSGDAAPVVQIGWNFTAGMVNMMLAIAFIIIAISIILGIGSYGLKKALPKLILVAFLVNFTLLFVGMGIDVSNFLFESIAGQFSSEGGENILWEAIMPLFDTLDMTIKGTVGLISMLGIQLATPYLGLAVQIFWAGSLILFLPMMLEMAVYGALALFMGFTFFIFFAVLLARIFVIQILAVIAPLAFFCLIFPDTEKWWKKWVEHLVQWLFVGVIFIFLMYLGLALVPIVGVLTDGITENLPELSGLFGFLWEGDLINYLILLIYFVVILGVCKSFIPDLAKAMMAQAGSAVKAAKPFVGGLSSVGKKQMQKQMGQSDKFQEAMGRLSKMGGGRSKFPGGGMAQTALRRAGQAGKRQASQAKESTLDENEKKFKGFSADEKRAEVDDLKKKKDYMAIGGMILSDPDDAVDLLKNFSEEDKKKLFQATDKTSKKKAVGKAASSEYMRYLNKTKGEEEVEKFSSSINTDSELSTHAQNISKAIKSGDAELRKIAEKDIERRMTAQKPEAYTKLAKNDPGTDIIELGDKTMKKLAMELSGKMSESQLTPQDLLKAYQSKASGLYKHLGRQPAVFQKTHDEARSVDRGGEGSSDRGGGGSFNENPRAGGGQ